MGNDAEKPSGSLINVFPVYFDPLDDHSNARSKNS